MEILWHPSHVWRKLWKKGRFGHLRNFSVYLVGNKRPCFQRPLNLSTLNWNFASYRQRKCQPYRSQNTDYARSVFSKASFTPLPLSQSHQGNSIKWGIASSEDRIVYEKTVRLKLNAVNIPVKDEMQFPTKWFARPITARSKCGPLPVGEVTTLNFRTRSR